MYDTKDIAVNSFIDRTVQNFHVGDTLNFKEISKLYTDPKRAMVDIFLG
jgi:hypothetical protein